MEILEERNIFKEFMKYPLNNPIKDLNLRVLSLHLRPLTRNKPTRNNLDKIEKSSQSSQTIQVGGRRKDAATTQAKPETNFKVPQTPQSERQQENAKLGETYFKRKGRPKNRNKPRRPAKIQEPKLMQEREEGEGYKEVKRKNLQSRSMEHFARSWRKEQLKGKRQSMSWKIKPTDEEFQRSGLPRNWGNVGHLPLPPMIDGQVLSKEAPVLYNQLGEEKYYNTQQVDGEEMQKPVLWDGSRDHVPLDHTKPRILQYFSESGGKETSKEPSLTEDHLEEESSVVTIANKPFNYFPNGGAEQTSMIVLPTRNGVRDSELPPDNLRLWRMVVSTEDIPIIDIDIYSDTIQPAETHTGPHNADHHTQRWSQGDILLQAEGSGKYRSRSLDREEKIITLTPNTGSAQMTQETQESLLPQLTATIQQSLYNTAPSPTHSNTAVPRVTGSEELLDGIPSPLEATKNHNHGPIYCKPGYKEYYGVCKSQCDIGVIYSGDNGQCVIVENIGAMCRLVYISQCHVFVYCIY